MLKVCSVKAKRDRVLAALRAQHTHCASAPRRRPGSPNALGHRIPVNLPVNSDCLQLHSFPQSFRTACNSSLFPSHFGLPATPVFSPVISDCLQLQSFPRSFRTACNASLFPTHFGLPATPFFSQLISDCPQLQCAGASVCRTHWEIRTEGGWVGHWDSQKPGVGGWVCGKCEIRGGGWVGCSGEWDFNCPHPAKEHNPGLIKI